MTQPHTNMRQTQSDKQTLAQQRIHVREFVFSNITFFCLHPSPSRRFQRFHRSSSQHSLVYWWRVWHRHHFLNFLVWYNWSGSSQLKRSGSKTKHSEKRNLYINPFGAFSFNYFTVCSNTLPLKLFFLCGNNPSFYILLIVFIILHRPAQ